MVGVIIKCKFDTGFGKKKYSGYINYSDREVATNNEEIRNLSEIERDVFEEKLRYDHLERESKNFYDSKYSGMINYIYRKNAKDKKDEVAIFTETSDKLTKEEKKNLKKVFDDAQKNKSILWEDVISFDNKWLEKNGLYDSKNKILDDKKIKEVVRSAMKTMLENEEMIESAIWCANIHYNTKNIHVHIASVEPKTLRKQKVIVEDGKKIIQYRGKRKAKSIAKMKSKVVNETTNNNEYLKEINDIIRRNIISSSKEKSLPLTREMKKIFKEIYKKLPEDRRQWNYNYNTLSNVKPLLDNLSKLYIEKYHKEDFENLVKNLDNYEETLKESYGSGKGKSYKNYKQNKIDELYIRMGNTILKELKAYDKKKKESSIESFINKRTLDKKFEKKQSIKTINNQLSYSMNRLKYLLSDEYDNFKNRLDYENLERDINREQ